MLKKKIKWGKPCVETFLDQWHWHRWVLYLNIDQRNATCHEYWEINLANTNKDSDFDMEITSNHFLIPPLHLCPQAIWKMNKTAKILENIKYEI